LQLSNVDIITALYAKIGTEANAWGFLWIDTHTHISIHANSHILKLRWREVTDWATRRSIQQYTHVMFT